MKGLILEGIVGSGKSSILRFLRKHINENGSSSFVLDENMTERPLEPLKSSDVEKSTKHLNRLVQLMKNLFDLESVAQKSRQIQVQFVLERFHFSHCLDIAGIDRFSAYADIDKQMRDLGSKLVVLTMREDVIHERSVVSTKKNRGEAWTRYLEGIAPNEKGVTEFYTAQQEYFIALCRNSVIPSMVVDTSNCDWEEVSFQIVDFLNRA